MENEIIKRSNKYGILKYLMEQKYQAKSEKDFNTLNELFEYRKRKYALYNIETANKISIDNIETIQSIEDLKKATLNYVTDEDRELLLKYIKLANEIINKNIVETKDFSNVKVLKEKIDRYLKENNIEI